MSSLNHPHILSLLSFVESATEQVIGGSLSSISMARGHWCSNRLLSSNMEKRHTLFFQWMFFEHAPLGDLYNSTVFKTLNEDDACWLLFQVRYLPIRQFLYFAIIRVSIPDHASLNHIGLGCDLIPVYCL